MIPVEYVEIFGSILGIGVFILLKDNILKIVNFTKGFELKI